MNHSQQYMVHIYIPEDLFKFFYAVHLESPRKIHFHEVTLPWLLAEDGIPLLEEDTVPFPATAAMAAADPEDGCELEWPPEILVLKLNTEGVWDTVGFAAAAAAAAATAAALCNDSSPEDAVGNAAAAVLSLFREDTAGDSARDDEPEDAVIEDTIGGQEKAAADSGKLPPTPLVTALRLPKVPAYHDVGLGYGLR